MKNRKFFIYAVIAVIIFTSALVIYDTKLINGTRKAVGDNSETEGMVSEADGVIYQMGNTIRLEDLENVAAEVSPQLPEESQNEILINEEIIDVSYNSPEYDLEMKLCENSEKETFIRLRYYLNGEGNLNDLKESEIPELSGLFDKRGKEAGKGDVYKIGQALLNPVHSQLYILIHGGAADGYSEVSLYLIGLNDMSVIRLISYPGIYGKLSFNRDYSMLAYSLKVPPQLSSLREEEIINVFSCIKSEFIIKASRDRTGNIIGKNNNTGFLYNYEFRGWNSLDTIRLLLSPMGNGNVDPVKNEVIYDVGENLLLNLDGSVLDFARITEKKSGGAGDGTNSPAGGSPAETGTPGSDGGQGQESEGASGDNSSKGGSNTTDGKGSSESGGKVTEKQLESEPVKLLRQFYSYLESENDYQKAMDLLDESFVLRLTILKQFGAEEIVKSDIDSETASLYSQLLKAAKFDTITKVDMNDSSCMVTYYQLFGMNPDSQVRQLLHAELKKSNGKWKINMIKDE